MVRAMLGASPFIKEPTPAQMKETPIEAETVLVTVGRAPNTAGLGLAEAGVAVDGRGWIRADEHMRTSLPGVYAVATRSGRPESCWPMSPPPRGCAPCAIALGMTGGWTIPPCRPASSRRPKSAAWGLPKRRLPRRAAMCVRPRSRCANSARRRPWANSPGCSSSSFGRGHGQGARRTYRRGPCHGSHRGSRACPASGRVRPGHRRNHPRPPHLGGGPVRSRAFPRRGWRMKHWGRKGKPF